MPSHLQGFGDIEILVKAWSTWCLGRRQSRFWSVPGRCISVMIWWFCVGIRFLEADTKRSFGIRTPFKMICMIKVSIIYSSSSSSSSSSSIINDPSPFIQSSQDIYHWSIISLPFQTSDISVASTLHHTKVTMQPSGPWPWRQRISRRFVGTLWLHGQKPWSYAGQQFQGRSSIVMHSVSTNQSEVDSLNVESCLCCFYVAFMSHSKNDSKIPDLSFLSFDFRRITSSLFRLRGVTISQFHTHHWLILSRKMEEDSVQADLGTYNGPLSFFILVPVFSQSDLRGTWTWDTGPSDRFFIM